MSSSGRKWISSWMELERRNNEAIGTGWEGFQERVGEEHVNNSWKANRTPKPVWLKSGLGFVTVSHVAKIFDIYKTLRFNTAQIFLWNQGEFRVKLFHYIQWLDSLRLSRFHDVQRHSQFLPPKNKTFSALLYMLLISIILDLLYISLFSNRCSDATSAIQKQLFYKTCSDIWKTILAMFISRRHSKVTTINNWKQHLPL